MMIQAEKNFNLLVLDLYRQVKDFNVLKPLIPVQNTASFSSEEQTLIITSEQRAPEKSYVEELILL